MIDRILIRLGIRRLLKRAEAVQAAREPVLHVLTDSGRPLASFNMPTDWTVSDVSDES